MGKTRFLSIHKTVVILRYFDIWSAPPSERQASSEGSCIWVQRNGFVLFFHHQGIWINTNAGHTFQKSMNSCLKWLSWWFYYRTRTLFIYIDNTFCSWRVSKGHDNMWTQAISRAAIELGLTVPDKTWAVKQSAGDAYVSCFLIEIVHIA